MGNSLILKGKRAVVFGAAGSIGRAVAKEFASEGAEVFLAGRSGANLEEVAGQIASADGHAHVAVVDALDDAAVNRYVDGLVKEFGSIDVAFNAVGPKAEAYGNGKHAIALSADEFMLPLTTVVKSQFLTARAAARHMVKQRTGVIIFLTGSPARGHVEGATAIGAAFGAIETLTENLAVEVSPLGVRVVCLRTTANVDSTSIQDTMQMVGGRINATKEQMVARLAEANLLKTPASVSDTAKLAALLASDRVRLLTATVVNSTAGAAAD